MRLFLAMNLLFLIACAPVRVGAEPSHTCSFIEGIMGLPRNLDSVRSGRREVAQFSGNLIQMLHGLQVQRRRAIFSNAEMRALQSYFDAVSKDWKLNGSSRSRHQTSGVANEMIATRRELSNMLAKFGCEPARANAPPPMWNADDTESYTMSFLAIGVLLTFLILGITRLLWRRQERRRMCRVSSLLRYEPNCTISTIVNISRSGALVELPVGSFPTDKLKVHVVGSIIPARVAWYNSNFAGLKFNKKISSKLLDEITGKDYDIALSDNLAEATPSCFQPGCHLTCKAHRPTVSGSKKTSSQP